MLWLLINIDIRDESWLWFWVVSTFTVKRLKELISSNDAVNCTLDVFLLSTHILVVAVVSAKCLNSAGGPTSLI